MNKLAQIISATILGGTLAGATAGLVAGKVIDSGNQRRWEQQVKIQAQLKREEMFARREGLNSLFYTVGELNSSWLKKQYLDQAEEICLRGNIDWVIKTYRDDRARTALMFSPTEAADLARLYGWNVNLQR